MNYSELLTNLRTSQMDRILVDAFQDPKLFKSLLANPNTQAMGQVAAKRTYLGKYLLTNFFSDVSEKGIPLVGEGGDEAEMQAAREQERPMSKMAETILSLIKASQVSPMQGAVRNSQTDFSKPALPRL